MTEAALAALLATCAPSVHPETGRAVVLAESAGNPHAIGVVSGSLKRQPQSRAEAFATARALEESGRNFSVGLAQINVKNIAAFALTLEEAFDPCRNLTAMQRVLTGCYERGSARATGAQQRLRDALSCYYSGDFVTGFRHGYVGRVARHAAASSHPNPVQANR